MTLLERAETAVSTLENLTAEMSTAVATCTAAESASAASAAAAAASAASAASITGSGNGNFGGSVPLIGVNSITASASSSLTLNGGTSLKVIQSQSGMVLSGTVAGGTGIYRSDASLTVTRAGAAGSAPGHAMIDIFHNRRGVSGGAGGTAGEESVVNFSMLDIADNAQQLGSISFIWAYAGDSGTGADARSQCRIHMNHIGGGSNSDLRLTADGGVEFFGTSDTTWPGDKIVQITAGSLKITGHGVSGLSSIFHTSSNQMVFQGDTGGILFQKSDNSVSLLSLNNATHTATFAGAITLSAGAPAASTLFVSSNRLCFCGGTSGYLFQKSDNSATILTMLDSLVSTFAGNVVFTGGGHTQRSVWGDATRLFLSSGSAGTFIQNSDSSVSLLSLTDSLVTVGEDFKVASGKHLTLGNAYASGAITTTGYLLVKDSTGTVYELAAKLH